LHCGSYTHFYNSGGRVQDTVAFCVSVVVYAAATEGITPELRNESLLMKLKEKEERLKIRIKIISNNSPTVIVYYFNIHGHRKNMEEISFIFIFISNSVDPSRS
jgi:hypothetical protein